MTIYEIYVAFFSETTNQGFFLKLEIQLYVPMYTMWFVFILSTSILVFTVKLLKWNPL